MDKASKAVRRSGVRLLSLGGGHGDLNMVISEQKDVKNHAKAFMAAQNSASQYLMKWAINEENRAIQDVSSQLVELNQIWTEAQREFAEHLKDFKHMFELILEGEKQIDQARNHLMACEQREGKIKKELKKAAKKATAEEIHALETRLAQAERQQDLAKLELEDKIRENEAVKVIRFKEGLMKLSNAYIELGRKCAIIYEANKDITHQLPDVQDKDLEDIKYTGSGATKHYVLLAKERVRQYKQRGQNQSYVNIPSQAEPPPPYTPGDFYDLHPDLYAEPSQIIDHPPQGPNIDHATQYPTQRFAMQHHPPHHNIAPHHNVPPHNASTRRQRLSQRQDTDDVNWGSDEDEDVEAVSGAMGGLRL